MSSIPRPTAGSPAILQMRQDEYPATIIDAFSRGSALYVVARRNDHGTRYVFRSGPGGKWLEVIENPTTGRFRLLRNGVGLKID